MTTNEAMKTDMLCVVSMKLVHKYWLPPNPTWAILIRPPIQTQRQRKTFHMQ